MHYSESPFSKYRIHLLLISALLLLSHNFWPKRVISLLPDSVELKLVDVDSKAEVGGSSQHRWIDEEYNTWECDIGDKAPYPYCAVVFIWSDALPLTKLDLSRLDRLEIVVDYEGDASRLKIFLRDYYPLVGSAEFQENPVFEEAIYNAQFNQVYVKVEQSERDLLTALYNRQGLKVKIRQLRENGLLAQYMVLVVDVDHFKQVNDTHGHAVGDQILVELAEVIRCNLREQDHAARWGGEEFVLLIKSDLGSTLDSFVDRLRTRISSNHFNAFSMDTKVLITVSIGGAHIADYGNFEATFEKADKALYSAKNSGRNKYVVSQGRVTELALQRSSVVPYTV